ncbi:hypothetical protein N9V24_05315 [Pseudomonadota bacterium]|nr:hypothetical protein [Pseudomonadota bacterium]
MSLRGLWEVITFEISWLDANIFLVLLAVGFWCTVIGFSFILVQVIFDNETWKKEKDFSWADFDWDTISNFSEVMEKTNWSQAFYDTSELPHPKSKIRDALIRKYNETEEDENNGIVRTGLIALTRFQDNVGSKPIIRGTIDILYTELSGDTTQAEREELKIDKELYESLDLIATDEYRSYKKHLLQKKNSNHIEVN